MNKNGEREIIIRIEERGENNKNEEYKMIRRERESASDKNKYPLIEYIYRERERELKSDENQMLK